MMRWNKCLQISFFTLIFHFLLTPERNDQSDDTLEEGKDVISSEIYRHERRLQSDNVQNGNENHSFSDSTLTKNGIFWSDFAESLVPKGLSCNESFELVKKLRGQSIERITPSSQTVCGSGTNGIVKLADGTKMCARREKRPLLVLAEVLAFYLSRLLRMDNIPESFLAKVDRSYSRWERVNFTALRWKENDTVAIIKWISDSGYETYMPEVIRSAFISRDPITNVVLDNNMMMRDNHTATAELIQWGSLIIFDYLIGHHDRLAYYQPIGRKGVWRRNFDSSLYNSVKSSSNKIWLIDNESGFFDEAKFGDFIFEYSHLLKVHDRMLRTMCVFQSSLVNELQSLSSYPSAFVHLLTYSISFEPLLSSVLDDDRFPLSAKVFDVRLSQILKWIESCRSMVI